MLLREFDEYKILKDIDDDKNKENRFKIISFIEKNCTEILELYGAYRKALYRGINREVPGTLHLKDGDVFFGKSPEDRRPTDIPLNIQTAIDKHLKDVGFTALRSNSIFCHPNFILAQGYGEPYIIFPIDGFTYSWCTSAEDLFDEHIRGSIQDYYPRPQEGDREKAEQFQEDLYRLPSSEFVNEYGFKKDDLKGAIIRQHEVLIHGDYVAISGKLGKEIFRGEY